MKELLLHAPLYDFIAEEFINKLNEVPLDEDITIRLSSPGGSVFAGWGIIAAITERTGETFLKIDGHASSMGFFMTLFFKTENIQALDVSKFMIHRASGYIGNDDDQKFLDDVNSDLRSKLESKIKPKLFKEIVGVSIKEIFEGEDRRDIYLTAKQAKKIGLIGKVRRLTPIEANEMKTRMVAFSNFESEEAFEAPQGSGTEKETENNNNINNLKKVEMDEKILIKQGYDAGVKAESDRIGAFLAFSDVDLEAVKKGIESGEACSQKFMAEMTRKAMSNASLKEIKAESPDALKKAKEEKKEITPEALKFEADEKEAFEAAGIEYKPSKN